MKKSYTLQTEDDCKRSINSLIKLIDMARGDSSGERTIRKFLLNLYNPSNPAVGFNALDHNNFEMCLDVLLLHRTCGREIHKYIQNGSAIFAQLWRIENPNHKRLTRRNHLL